MRAARSNWIRPFNGILAVCSSPFSKRARLVVFAMRFKAGARGADEIGVDNLLVGLISGHLRQHKKLEQ